MTIPLTCGITLAAMLGAGISHWWSVRQFVDLMEHGMTVPAIQQPSTAPATTPVLAAQDGQPIDERQTAALTTNQKAFYEALIEKMARVENQNRDLLDQLAETNRDLMKLEFRVDTHSESFRPLPIDQGSSFSTNNQGIGVLPPRTDPSGLPAYE